MADTQNSGFQISQKDLAEKGLTRLNQVFGFIFDKLSKVETSIKSMIAAGATKTAAVGICLGDTHANRLANYNPQDLAIGTELVETDRGAIYQIRLLTSPTQGWKWIGGVMDGTLIPNTKPSDLGANDAGFRFHSTDFDHMYRWSGSAWAWAAEDDHRAGEICGFRVAPDASRKFKLMDGNGDDGNPGTNISFAKSDGTVDTSSVNGEDYSLFYQKFTGAYVPPASAGAQSITGVSAVDGGAGQVVQSGTGATVAAHTHTHASGTLAVAYVGGDAVSHVGLLPYFRK